MYVYNRLYKDLSTSQSQRKNGVKVNSTLVMDKKIKSNFNITANSELAKKIKLKRQKLKKVAKSLKRHFVGLDDIIDKVIKNIEAWYIMPEVVMRPVIVNLWGMTGVGKTDLVRRLVRELKCSDRYLEVQLTNKGTVSGGYHDSLQEVMTTSAIEPGEPGVLLLDEIQRFRTIDETGCEIHDYRFQDVWTLLSDGKFSSDSDCKDSLLELALGEKYWIDNRNDDDNEEDSTENGSKPSAKAAKRKKRMRIYHQPYYTARKLKRLLKLNETLEEIMKWTEDKKNQVVYERIKTQDVYEGADYSKLLVFISGNLDEAFDMSHDCQNASADADLFHEHCKSINVLSIKSSLRERFKPEQIARFGNTHIIYRSLNSASFKKIIDRRIVEIQKNLLKRCWVSISVDKSIKEFIYRNGVFPVQGVRPLFSTISSSLESYLPRMVLLAIELNSNKITVYYKDDYVCSEIDGKHYKIQYDKGDIDAIRKNIDINTRISLAVHEAGHAVVYASVFGHAPPEVILHSDTNATTASDFLAETYGYELNKIAVSLGGLMASEIVLGKELSTLGTYSDIIKATRSASMLIRESAMGDFISRRALGHSQESNDLIANHDESPTDEAIEVMLGEQKVRVTKILKENLQLIIAITDTFIECNKIKSTELEKLCKSYSDIKLKPRTKALVQSVSPEIYKEYMSFRKETLKKG